MMKLKNFQTKGELVFEMQKPNIRRKCFAQWSYADKQNCFELKGLILGKAEHLKYKHIFKSHKFQDSDFWSYSHHDHY